MSVVSLLGSVRIGVRLSAGFIAVVALFVVNLLLVGVSFSHLMQDIKQVDEETLPYILTVDEMNTARSEVQQFLTDVSATHNRDGYKDADEAAKLFLAGVEKYKQMYQRENDAGSLKKMQDIEASFNTFYNNGKAMAEAYITQGMDAGNAAMEGFDKNSQAISSELAGFRAQQIAEASRITAGTASLAASTMKVIIGGGLTVALLATVLSVLITRSIVQPMSAMKSAMVEISKTRDFTHRVEVDNKDELGQTAHSFNELIGNLQTTLNGLRNDIDGVSDASRVLSAASHQVATGSAHQSEATSSMAASVEQMTVSIAHVSDIAGRAQQLSHVSSELSDQGKKIIHNAASEMKQIADTVRQTAISIEDLGQQSTQISTIIQVIKDVADQTNLLALNAAIEAARAGEQGRGFAVVADEVRKLAERTSLATGEITHMIDAIQNTARVAVGSMSGAVSQVDSGVALAQQAGDAINQIKEESEQLHRTVGDISAALAEQSAASNGIASHVEQVAQMTEENSAAAKETAGTANNLALLSEDMRTTINRFKC